jgi:DNA polymerase-3 subunit delta'
MRFSDIPGLGRTKDKLRRAVEAGKIAHAQMFAGPAGSANLTMALAYATYLNCTDRKEGDSCGQCPSCTKADKLIHPDLHLVFPVSAAGNKSGKDVVSDSFVAEWRQFALSSPYGGSVEWSMAFGGENKQLNISREESRNIVRKMALKPYEGTYKVMLIWLAEFMHPTAANALLKLLEEPPDKTVFLLVTNDAEQIIGTIFSRVQMLRIRGFDNDEVVNYLVSQYHLAEEQSQKIAIACAGNLNQAIKLINDGDQDTRTSFQDWMRTCFKLDYIKMVQASDQFSKITKIQQQGFLQYGMSTVRNTLLSRHQMGQLIHTNSAEKEFADNFAKAFSNAQLEKLYNLLNSASYHLERNGNPKIVFLDTSLHVGSTFRT